MLHKHQTDNTIFDGLDVPKNSTINVETLVKNLRSISVLRIPIGMGKTSPNLNADSVLNAIVESIELPETVPTPVKPVVVDKLETSYLLEVESIIPSTSKVIADDKFDTRELGASPEHAVVMPVPQAFFMALKKPNEAISESAVVDSDTSGFIQSQVPTFVPSTKEEILERAMKSIGMLDRDAGIAELEGDGGRVQVDDKAMINCRADLNQLVPFKYEWAWQAYLKATEHHWMPTEINLTKDVDDWTLCTPDESKLIQFALYSLEIHANFRTNDPLLAIYRFITNPEARQYILRQRFEITVWGNFVHHAIDSFGYNDFPSETIVGSKGNSVVNCDWYGFTDAQYKSYLAREHIARKQKLRHSIESFVGDNLFEPTDNLDDTFGLVSRTLQYYLCFGFIYNFASLIQLVGLADKGKFSGLSQGATLILRDVSLHTSAGILILRNIYEENPEVNTPENRNTLLNIIKTHCDAEIDYMDWWANSDVPSAKSSEQIQTLKYMVNRFTEELGLGSVYESELRVPSCPAFVSKFDAFTPNLQGGGSSVLGNGGTLSFDSLDEVQDDKGG